VTGVKDMSHAFSTTRSSAYSDADPGNDKAALFVGAGLANWITTSVTSLEGTFRGAGSFVGNGLSKWDVVKVTIMVETFWGATSLTSCNKRKIADAWKSNPVFAATTYVTKWAADTCTVRFE
jgi:hypothetical protein